MATIEQFIVKVVTQGTEQLDKLGKSTDALNAINLDPTSLDKGAAPAPAPARPKTVEAPVVEVAEAPVEEPKKREAPAKKVETPTNLESLLEEWED